MSRVLGNTARSYLIVSFRAARHPKARLVLLLVSLRRGGVADMPALDLGDQSWFLEG